MPQIPHIALSVVHRSDDPTTYLWIALALHPLAMSTTSLWIATRRPQEVSSTVGGMESELTLDGTAAIRSHLDLLIEPKERTRHGVWFALCDEQARPIVHAAVDDADPDPPESTCEEVVTPFAMVLGERGEGRLLVAVTRPGNSTIGAVERRWFHAVHAVCRRYGVPVLAVYLVTPRDIVPIQLDDAI